MSKRVKLKGVSLDSFLHYPSFTTPMDWPNVFKSNNPLHVEVGFGTGEFLVRLAQDNPNINFIGIEQCWKRVAKALRKITETRVTNVRVLKMDAWAVLNSLIDLKSCDKVYCLFPCPWPKDKHEQHRLFDNQFLKLVNSRLTDQGQIYFVSDHKNYVDWIVERSDKSGFQLTQNIIDPKFDTKFERKWVSEGQKKFYELTFDKKDHIDVSLQKQIDMKSYCIDQFDPAQFKFEEVIGDITIVFKDLLFDQEAQKALLQFVVTEDHLIQNVWVYVLKQENDWRICLAGGVPVLSTDGVQLLLEKIYSTLK